MISTDGLLQKQQYIHGLKHDFVTAPHSIVQTILNDFHNLKGHQGTIHTFEAIRRFYQWPKLHQDIIKYMNKCNISATKHELTKYGQIPTKASRNTTSYNGIIGYGHYRLSSNYN